MTILTSREDSTFLPCDDYRECVENTLMVLGAQPPCSVHFLKPGALRQARRTACNGIKMFMFSIPLPCDKEMVVKLERFNRFLAFCYVPLWTRSCRAQDANLLDLQFFCDMHDYKVADHEVAKEVA